MAWTLGKLALLLALASAREVELQVEYRLNMLCEQSGFILEALDFLHGLNQVGFEVPVAVVGETEPVTVRLDVALTGLFGDCAGLATKLSPTHAATFLGLRAVDAAHSGSSQWHSSCLLRQDATGQFSLFCESDRLPEAEGGPPPLPPPREVSLRPHRLTIEHGLPCAMRKQIRLNASDFAEQYGAKPDVLVARCMTETDVLSKKDAQCLREAQPDHVWVPTAWHQHIYQAASSKFGLNPEQVLVLPEIVDTEFFDRALAAPRTDEVLATAAQPRPFVFLSVFKWEWRKGWDVLLLGYWRAFADRPDAGDVVLRIKTFRPPGGLVAASIESGVGDIAEDVAHLAELMMQRPLSELPRVELLTDSFPREGIRQLFADADAFVLPTRGEGWGLPIVEAMAMGLPVIATNYSGPSAYLTPRNAYPLPIDGVDSGSALPSVRVLVELLQRVVDRRDEAAAKGAQAALDTRQYLSSRVVGATLRDLVLAAAEKGGLLKQQA